MVIDPNKFKTSFLKDRQPKIVIPYNIYKDIESIVNSVNGEIGWIGEAVKEGTNTYRITNVTVPKQEANSATTEISSDGIIEVDEVDDFFNMENFKCWSHSHGNLGISPSGQDKTQMMEFATMCDDWFIGTIHNKRGAVHGYIVIGGYLYVDDIEVVIEQSEEVDKLQESIEIVEQGLKEEVKKLEEESKGVIKSIKDEIKKLEKEYPRSRDWAELIDKRVTKKTFGNYGKNKHNNYGSSYGNNYGSSYGNNYGASQHSYEAYRRNHNFMTPEKPTIRHYNGAPERDFLKPPKANEEAVSPFSRANGILFVKEPSKLGAMITKMWAYSLRNPEHYYKMYPRENFKVLAKQSKKFSNYAKTLYGVITKDKDKVTAKQKEVLINSAKMLVYESKPKQMTGAFSTKKWRNTIDNVFMFVYNEKAQDVIMWYGNIGIPIIDYFKYPEYYYINLRDCMFDIDIYNEKFNNDAFHNKL